ncbi:MAG: hypothetical protein AAF633_05675 [Chloroflexota bacterium]
MDEYFNLGDYYRPITTASKEAERWFNRGLIWCYAFHHTEAIRCFNKVIKADPSCAMGYWGLAYAFGPYYNITWNGMPPQMRAHALRQTFENSRKADQRKAGCTSVEKALIEAFIIRFPAANVDGDDDELEEVFAEWDLAYAHAMRKLYARFPDDQEICALTAESLMVRTPWQLWNLETGTPAEGADTLEAATILEESMARAAARGDQLHPGLHHFYIHCMEMSPTPEKALPVADRLRHLVPDAGHLNHMPSHIYVLCGQYAKTIDSNVEAVVADDKYLAVDSDPGIFTLYHTHNIHFQVYGALFSGQYTKARRAAEMVEERITFESIQIDIQSLANFLESLYPVKAHVYVRFGKWEEIIAEQLPEDQALYAVTTASWHYAKGIAHAVLGNIEEALAHQEHFRNALKIIPEDRINYQNAALDIMAIADAMLDGELEYRRENYEIAFEHLRRSVLLYDNLNYAEPWAWMQPPRHALGALLLEQGHVQEAAAVYRADLGLDNSLQRPSQHPNNVWALHGYAECCERLGHDEEAAIMRERLAAAEAVADVPITASCFCRKSSHCCD